MFKVEEKIIEGEKEISVITRFNQLKDARKYAYEQAYDYHRTQLNWQVSIYKERKVLDELIYRERGIR